MTMFTLLLISVLCLALPITSLESVVDNQGSGCSVDRQFREAIDKFHNELRQRIARGDGEKPGQEMYGLIYDCGLEKEADSEVGRPGSADASHGIVRFSGEFDGRVLEGLQKILRTLYSDEAAMKQIKYPKATRFGCTGRLKRNKHTGKPKQDWTCIYDVKPKDGESVDGGKSCKQDSDCTFYPGSTCAWDLCYTWF
ncbi:hypothetical protein ANCCAN_16018 [Ancylostoma caninum]|uniref:SCP domain-containing protein n=1 Tax=Ancylostoma caninum TaxID=29170 RepID=A0A368G0S8_ANCCA|nr:hypothetical protein ANCCAN_16018 [Ancylostoma caninum]